MHVCTRSVICPTLRILTIVFNGVDIQTDNEKETNRYLTASLLNRESPGISDFSHASSLCENARWEVL